MWREIVDRVSPKGSASRRGPQLVPVTPGDKINKDSKDLRALKVASIEVARGRGQHGGGGRPMKGVEARRIYAGRTHQLGEDQEPQVHPDHRARETL